MKRYEILILVVIVAIAAFFRLYNLDMAPPGLYPDEAMNGTNSAEALETGNFKVFYPENNGREGLYINLQAIPIYFFGNIAWSLRVTSAVMGILTVWGLYLLARLLFNWQIAAFSSFLMAVSFWHVNFSRIGFRAIMAPLLLVWGFYFFWKGLRGGRWHDFLVSGLIWGLGFHTYIAYRVMPLVLLVVLAGYVLAVRKDFSHDKYTYTRRRIVAGMIIFSVAAVLVAMPLLLHFSNHPEDFVGRVNKTSVFSVENPTKRLALNLFQTLGMFTFEGDYNWRHNIAGSPTLYWPVGALFAVGFLSGILKLFKIRKKHGHFSPVHCLLYSWFFVGLIPTVFSNEGLPHSLRAIIIAPVVFIFAGKGLWWLFETLNRWYQVSHMHELDLQLLPHRHIHTRESILVSVLAAVFLMTTISMAEYDRYFNVWSKNSNVADEFRQPYVDIADELVRWSDDIPKYVVANAGDVYVNGISVHARTVMYLTGTYSETMQKRKNIYYLSEEDYRTGKYPPGAVIFLLMSPK